MKSLRLVGLALCLVLVSTAAVRADETKITVAALSPPDIVELYYAIDHDLFRKAGLDVTVQPMNNGAASMAALVGGSAQIGYGNVLSLALAHRRGIPVQLIAPGGGYDTKAVDAAVLVASDAPFKTPRDLEGRTIAVVSLHDLTAVSIEGWLEKAGADATKVHFAEMPPSSMLAALEAKRVDAMGVYEPFLSNAEMHGAKIFGKSYDSIAPAFMVTGWFALTPWADQHKAAVARFADVLSHVSPYVNTHYDELIPLISRITKIPPEALHHMAHPYIYPSLATAPIQPVIDAAAKFHEIPEAFPARELIFPGIP
ncbi:MAG: ABC transporter substrate-binding protein [Candidatus Eremiobacteraeota bacterium]|nr:ABC transporter substrate-binding protein [Candidatus Eremiobacteraeota bacterium]